MNDFQKTLTLLIGLVILFSAGYLIGHLLKLDKFYKFKKNERK